MTADEILANARALVPEITRRADETARLRQVPRDLAEKLRAAGVFRIMFPKTWGGPEMPLPQQVELMEILAVGDPSVSWAVKIGSDSGYFSAWLDEAAARDLYPSIDYATAGQAPPHGRAVRVPGGYRVTGRWGFASGCTHADVMAAGCMVVDDEQTLSAPRVTMTMADMIFVLAPVSSWTIEDTWHSHGLAGSGSHHYSAKDLFIPESHTFKMQGRAKFDGALYADGGSATIFIPMVGTPLGLMRRSIESARAVAEQRVVSLPPPPTPMKDLPSVHAALARAQMLYGSARAYAYDSVNRLWDELVTSGRGALETRRDVGLSRIYAYRTACDVAQLMFDTVGAPAVHESLPLGRLLRDAVTMNQHLGFNAGVVERLGRMMLGGDPEGAFV